MRVDRLHPARLGDERLDLAIVIDVLRATSTAAALAGRESRRILVVGDPSELVRLPADRDGYVVFSELRLEEMPHDQVDNSPTVAGRIDLAGRTPVLVTTNGTKAIRAALSAAKTVLLASFSNLYAVARRAPSLASERITVLPAGRFDSGEERAEDEACADALARLLRGEPCDAEAAAKACFDDARVRRRIEREPGFLEDARHSLAVGGSRAVLRAAPARDFGPDLIEIRVLEADGA